MTSVTACDERIETDSKPPELILTSDQESAIAEIEAAFKPGEFFLLTGNAGSGKTTLIQHFTKRMTAQEEGHRPYRADTQSRVRAEEEAGRDRPSQSAMRDDP